MKVAITGSTGMLGTALAQRLRSEGHEVMPVVRGDRSNPGAHWDPGANWVREGAFDGVDAVVNLSGANLGDKRWTASRKEELRTSRVDLTRFLVAQLGALPEAPAALVQASAVGYYGDRGDEELDETSSKGSGFLASLVHDWEAEGSKARDHRMRVALMRAGPILSARGGALKKMLLPFKLGAGGRVGSGRQYFSWVSIDDAVSAYVAALTSDLDGVVNVVAPNPVTNAEYTRALGRAVKRPTFLPVPTLALKALYGGELVDEMLLAGQRAIPSRLLERGFEFEHPEIDSALSHILRRDRS